MTQNVSSGCLATPMGGDKTSGSHYAWPDLAVISAIPFNSQELKQIPQTVELSL